MGFTQLESDTHRGLGAALLGYGIGTCLFGVTIVQAFQYFRTYISDSKRRKLFVIFVCSVDTLHQCLSTYMIYQILIYPTDHPVSASRALWSFKAIATAQMVVVLSIQMFYLHQIWTLSGNVFAMGRSRLVRAIRPSVFILFIYLIAFTAAFMFHLNMITSISSSAGRSDENYKLSHEMIYVAMAGAAFADCVIAAIMSFILFQSRDAENARSVGVIHLLTLHFVGSGALTALTVMAVIFACVTWPTTLFYLSVAFSMIRLYVNSMLALFNAKNRLRKRMDEISELRVSSALLFGDGLESTTTDTEA